jgi:hypothetical protein
METRAGVGGGGLKKTNLIIKLITLRGLSPRTNCTDRATAAFSAKVVSAFEDRGCRVFSATDPHGRIRNILDRSRYIFFQVAPEL